MIARTLIRPSFYQDSVALLGVGQGGGEVGLRRGPGDEGVDDVAAALEELPLHVDDYRAHLLTVVIRRAVETACARAHGKEQA